MAMTTPTMTILDRSEVLQAVCKAHGKWGMLIEIAFPADFHLEKVSRELEKATMGLINSENFGSMAQDIVLSYLGTSAHYALFDTQAELDDAFERRVYGDDNSEDHPYQGPLYTIRCLTCDTNRELMNENS
jgi:hypothetical protein